ncbi:MAG: hypothetical protein F6K54_15640 [Okeania sp. SIO3B5]|nr:hypothetical protein [Okeania sp. SIO3B5]
MIFRLSINAKHKFFNFTFARRGFGHGYTDDLSAFCEVVARRGFGHGYTDDLSAFYEVVARRGFSHGYTDDL